MNEFFKSFDEGFGDTLAEIKAATYEECRRYLKADEVALLCKEEFDQKLHEGLARWQRDEEMTPYDSGNFVVDINAMSIFPECLYGIVRIGERIAELIKEHADEDELERMLDANYRFQVVQNILRRMKLKELLLELLEEKLAKRRSEIEGNIPKRARKKRALDLFKSVLVSILGSLLLTIVLNIVTMRLAPVQAQKLGW